jgi:hypothetical protein
MRNGLCRCRTPQRLPRECSVKSERDDPAPARKAMPEELDKIADWLFAAPRLAVTRKQPDRVSIMTVARQMDRLGARSGITQLEFFGRKSAEFWDAIAGEDQPERLANLRRQMKAINDARLRRALGAVLEIEAGGTAAAWIAPPQASNNIAD